MGNKKSARAKLLIGKKVQFITNGGGKIFYGTPDDWYKIIGIDDLLVPTGLGFKTITEIRVVCPGGAIRHINTRDFAEIKEHMKGGQ